MKSRYIIIAGCIILGLIAFSCTANASVPKATVYISGSSVIAVDGQSNVIKQGTLGVDDATVIQAAINALDSSNSVLTISPGTYTIDKAIVFSGYTNLKIYGAGATIKLRAHYSPACGLYSGDHYGVYFLNCPGIQVYDITFDGNKANQYDQPDPNSYDASYAQYEPTLVNWNGCNNGYIRGVTFKNSNKIGMAIRQGTSTNLTFDTCHYLNNGNNGTDSNCFLSDTGSSYTFKNCDFYRNTIGDSPSQAFYVNSGTGYYYNNKFTNMRKVYDFRSGTHTVDGGYAKNSGMALITYANGPTVSMSNVYFDGLYGPVELDTVGGTYLTSGKTTLVNDTFIAGSGNANAWYGVAIDGTYSTVTGNVIRNCKISGFPNAGIFIHNTGGQGLMSGNTISNTGDYGFDSEGNTGTTTVSGNIVTGVGTAYYAPDGKLIVQSTATPTPTPAPTATPTPTPRPTATPTPTTPPQVPTPTPTPTATISLVAGWNLVSIPLAPQDNSLKAMLPTSVTSGLTSIWGWNETKQNWAYYSPDPSDGFYKSYPAITKLETGRTYWILMNKSASFTVTGTVPSGAPRSPVALVSGWNFVGLTGQTASTPSVMYPSALAVWGWDAARQNWVYYSPDPNDSFYQTYPKITSIQPGQGFWVNMA